MIQGLSPMEVRILKDIYDGIAVKPKSTADEDLKFYLDAVNDVREKTLDALLKAKEEGRSGTLLEYIKDTLQQQAGQRTDYLSSINNDNPTLVDLIFPYNGPRKHRRFHQDKALNEKVIVLGGQRFLNKLQPGVKTLRQWMEDVSGSWPAKQEAWQKKLRN